MPLVLASASFDSTSQAKECGEVISEFLSFSRQDPGRIIRICHLCCCWPPPSFAPTSQTQECGEVRVNFFLFLGRTVTNNPNMPIMLASASFGSSVRLWDVEKFRVHFLSFSWQDTGRIIRICRWCWPPPALTVPDRLRNVERFRVPSFSWQDPGRIIRICRWCWPQECGEVIVNFLSFSWQGPGRIIRICRWCWPPPALTLTVRL
jgi:hypothetical protein